MTQVVKFLGAFKDFFISEKLQKEEELYRKASILVWVCVGVILLCTAVTAADVAVGNTKFLPVFFILVAILGGILVGTRFGVQPAILANVLIMFCFPAIMFSMFERGGLMSAQVVFLVLIPPLMVSISGVKSAMFWALASCAAIFYFVATQWTSGEEIQFIADDEYFSNATANYISAVLFVAWMFIYTEHSRIEARRGMLREQERSDRLLLNILPEKAAEELKETGRYRAQHYESVTVLFTDFSGFTELSASMEPQELVSELDDCFTRFDRICKENGLEKIKTIGDAYMAVSGLPETDPDHARKALRGALAMVKAVEEMPPMAVHTADGTQGSFKVRVGLHSGSVVAGIVGSSKFQYDIWGDTVNTASRMESSGEVGKVNISEATYELVRPSPEFNFTSRGEIAAKGKGMMAMYFAEKSESA